MAVNTVNNNSSATATGKTKGKGMNLKAEDFINMMITQLQNQDPMEPAKNEQLLAQMSQIGQLQASTSLQESLATLVLQNNIGSAGNLIGKTINGLDENGKPLEGVVTAVKIVDKQVSLELDNGQTLSMSNVTSVAPTAVATAA